MELKRIDYLVSVLLRFNLYNSFPCTSHGSLIFYALTKRCTLEKLVILKYWNIYCQDYGHNGGQSSVINSLLNNYKSQSDITINSIFKSFFNTQKDKKGIWWPIFPLLQESSFKLRCIVNQSYIWPKLSFIQFWD